MFVWGVDYQTYQQPTFDFSEAHEEKLLYNGSIFYNAQIDAFDQTTPLGFLDVKKVSVSLQTQHDFDLFFKLLGH